MYIEFEKGQKFAKKGADVTDIIDGYQDAGYVLTDKDLIIDIDNVDKQVIRKLIEAFDIKTQIVETGRGYHLYFRKPTGFRGAKAVTPIGFEVEFKHIKNTKAITIKRDGVMRTIENEGEREELPFIFTNGKRKLESLYGLEENDGRNPKLWKHKMSMNNHPDTMKILNFINNYVFAEPMDQSEFETVSREQKITTDDKLTPHDVALQVAHVTKPVEFAKGIYYRDENDNYNFDNNEYKKLIFKLSPNKDPRFIDNVFKTIELMTEKLDDDIEFPVKFNNGVLQDGDFTEVEYKEFTPFVIDREYNEDAKPVPMVDEYLNSLTDNDEDYKKLIGEILGYTLETKAEQIKLLAKFFIFIGDGGNGKGTLLEIIRKILGSSNVSSLSIKNMGDSTYFPTLKGMLANLGDDLEDEPINNDQMKKIKNITTADNLTMRQMYKQAEDVKLKTTLIFTSNHMIKSFEKGGSFKRRIVWCPMFAKPKKADSQFVNKITTDEAIEYWVRIMVEGYMRLYENGKFSTSEKIENYNEKYHEENNNTIQFCEEHDVVDFENCLPVEVKDHYEQWCNEQAYESLSMKRLNEALKEVLNIEPKKTTRNGKQLRLYKKIEEK
ncbi:phage/plasmid primase, P4 family [Staphylococcus xylosus]|uniref:DNA primase family protein n=1 Tax=Staphylococcus xylosus TaxID=1288 RepID=UPI002DBBF769|nr:phage/plasmid primase, P4 family [Staphylococcus xylosus]MEB7755331.1 phage/plasmid primase, P4 family [Staphylococcus xylosus]